MPRPSTSTSTKKLKTEVPEEEMEEVLCEELGPPGVPGVVPVVPRTLHLAAPARVWRPRPMMAPMVVAPQVVPSPLLPRVPPQMPPPRARKPIPILTRTIIIRPKSHLGWIPKPLVVPVPAPMTTTTTTTTTTTPTATGG